MLQINKEDLIKQYVSFKTSSYRVDFSNEDILKLDRVEKILSCHGWLKEADETFESIKKDIDKKRNDLKSKIVEALKNCEGTTFFELDKKIESLKEEVINIDRFGFVRIEACREFFELVNISFLDRAQILMKLGKLGV